MTTVVDATGLDKSQVFVELYNFAKPLGMGIYQYKAEIMNLEEASLLLSKCNYFDYVFGRYMKVDFSKYPLVCSSLFGKHYGSGSMQNLISKLQKNA